MSSYPYYTEASSPNNIPVVQGQVVSDPSTSFAAIPQGNFSNEDVFHGEKQPNTCKDVFWAILFYAHLGAMAFVAVYYAPIMAQDMAADYAGGAYRKLKERFLQDEDGGSNNGGEPEDFDIDMTTLLTILGVCGLVALLVSSGAIAMMMAFPTPLIKIALFLNLFLLGVMTIMTLLSGALPMALLLGLMLVVNVCYIRAVWSRIAFASSTLVTSITAVKQNLGLAFFAYSNLIITFLWCIWWSVGFVATSYVISNCNAEGYCEGSMNGGLIFLFLVSFFWTAQVIKNVVHVTTAGTVATWWLIPHEASGCCSQAVRDSYWRSVTTSFGSICLGSLIVALIQAAREMLKSMRDQNDSLLLCIADCLIGCLERLAEYFNKWAYVYVGIYGYSFVEASMNVLNLFQSRGWSAIIADTLVDTVLMMVSFCVGVLTGLIGLVVASAMQQGGGTLAAAFFIGLLVGFVFCSTLFGLISSGVNAVIVLFAESPAEFAANHPELSAEMLKSWREAYPLEFQY